MQTDWNPTVGIDLMIERWCISAGIHLHSLPAQTTHVVAAHVSNASSPQIHWRDVTTECIRIARDLHLVALLRLMRGGLE